MLIKPFTTAALLLVLSTSSTMSVRAQAPASTTPAKAASAPVAVSAANRGLQIVINTAAWNNVVQPYDAGGLNLNFQIQHADGTPVVFGETANAVVVSGWTDTGFEADLQHAATAEDNTTDKNYWYACLPDIAPLASTAHLEFDVRDPSASTAQQDQLASEFRINDIPFPSKPNVTVPVDKSVTTDWGTVITLTGVTNDTSSNGQNEIRYDFKVDHSQVPDDTVEVQFDKAFDNGVQIDGLWSGNMTGPSSASSISLFIQSNMSEPHDSASIMFQFHENAESRTRSVIWTPLTVDIPLAQIQPAPATQQSEPTVAAVDLGSSTDDGVTYRIQRLTDANNPQASAYVISTRAGGTPAPCRILDAEWTVPDDRRGYQWNNQFTQGILNWNTDGTALAPNEFAVKVQANDPQSTFPLTVKSRSFTRTQQVVNFGKVPIPSAGQTMILDQQPDVAALVPLRLRSVAWIVPALENGGNVDEPQHLRLRFEYDAADGSSIAMAAISAQDDQADAVPFPANANFSPDPINSSDPVNQTIVVDESLPPSAAKFLNLTMFMTKDSPAGSPRSFSIASDGKWTVINP